MSKHISRLFIILIGLLLLAAAQSCIEEDGNKFTNNPNAYLAFSTDTLKFDTVFTSIGSASKQIIVYNKNKNAVRTNVSVQSNFYHIIVDGTKGNSLNNIVIRGGDSIYIFVDVTIDPQNSNSPVVILDSITFATNGNCQSVKLMAYGQDIHMITDTVIKTQTWKADKPYLICNSLLIDSLETLTIEEGTHLHFRPNTSLLVKGTLKVDGTNENPVVFEGDRLEEYYKNKPGQWGKVSEVEGTKQYLGNINFFTSSSNNEINYAVIRNGVKGVQINSNSDSTTTLKIANTIIENMSIAGIYAQSTNILVYNTIVTNCGYYAVFLTMGGNYEFFHTTIANYTTTRNTPSLVFSNYSTSGSNTKLFNFNATFANSIICGSRSAEFIADMQSSDSLNFNYSFENCLINLPRNTNISDTNTFRNVILAIDSLPRFVDVEKHNFRLDTLSAAKDKGKLQYGKLFPTDFDGNSRIDDKLPDLGAFERIENQPITKKP